MSENKNPSCPTCESELQEVNAGWYCKQCNVIVVFQDALQARIPQWISVKDRLPEDGTRVMAYVNGWHEVAWHRKSIREWQFRDEIAFNNETNTYGLVTHWMPLPEPPEENE